MLETEALDGVVELDIDAEVVGIELEFVAGNEAAVLGDIEGEGRDWAVESELPMPILLRAGSEIYHVLYADYVSTNRIY